jgi:hypothetical protein
MRPKTRRKIAQRAGQDVQLFGGGGGAERALKDAGTGQIACGAALLPGPVTVPAGKLFAVAAS